LENKDARARFGILKGLRGARLGRHPHAAHASRPAKEQNPGRGLHGVRGPHTPARQITNEARKHPTPDERGAHLGSTRIRQAAPAKATLISRPTGTSPGIRPKGPLPQNEIVRAQSQPQGPIRERRASTQAKRSGNSVACFTSRRRRPNHPPVMRERSNSQCSTG
jgi:hypothetical protein